MNTCLRVKPLEFPSYVGGLAVLLSTAIGAHAGCPPDDAAVKKLMFMIDKDIIT